MASSEHSLHSIFYLSLLLLFLLLLESCPGNLAAPKLLSQVLGFPGGSDGKESTLSVGDPGSISGPGRFPWRRKWHPTPVSLPGKSLGRRSLAGYSPRGHKELDTTEWLHFLSFCFQQESGVRSYYSVTNVSDSLWPHWLQHVRLLCLPLSPGVCSNPCPLSW